MFLQKLLTTIVITILFFQLPLPAFAEAGLSEAGRTVYYFWDDKYAVSILPGGEGAGGEDSVTFFEYEEANDRTPSHKVKIQGNNDKTYVSSSTVGSVNEFFHLPPTITGDFLWNSSTILNYDEGRVVYKESFDCLENPSEEYYEFSINDQKCAKYNQVLKDNNLNLNDPENETLNLEYAEENLTPMGTDGFLDSMGNSILFFLICLALLGITFFSGIVICIIAIVKMIKKNDGKKLLLVGIGLMVLPVVIFVGYYAFVFLRMLLFF